MSSIRTAILLPGGGIKIIYPFFLYYYNLLSRIIYTDLEDVYEDKDILTSRTVSLRFLIVFSVIIVLPVPVTPVINI
jgi:hypothetical protein